MYTTRFRSHREFCKKWPYKIMIRCSIIKIVLTDPDAFGYVPDGKVTVWVDCLSAPFGAVF